nr:MAG TPA: hypothetical protein [Caudoviricetes sp.]
MRGSNRSPSLISVVVCLVVERLADYGVAVAEERSYPIRPRRHCTCHNCKPRHSGRTCIGFFVFDNHGCTRHSASKLGSALICT